MDKANEISPEASKLGLGWNFYWPIMDVLIGGKSAIDLPHLTIHSPSEGAEFLKNYGYDMSKESDRKKAHALIIEAWSFIESTLMPVEWKKGVRPPDELYECSDPRQLMIWASTKSEEDELMRAWSCALLRVIHTAAHMDGVWAMIDADAASLQIRQRFEKFLHYEKGVGLWFGDERDRVLLEHIEWKVPKSRKSVFLKLLHKKANVAENIYDLLGVRIITKNLTDAMLVVKYLRDFHVVTFANCNPGRARNTLIDFASFRRQIDLARKKLLHGQVDVEYFYKVLSRIDKDLRQVTIKRQNPHSSENYQALQLTCRQLIQTENQAMGWEHKLQDYSRSLIRAGYPEEGNSIERILKYIANWPGFDGQKESSSFFPFEVQITDAKAYEVIRYGEASHERYKMSQVRAARRRVLAEVFRLVRKKNRNSKSIA